MSHDGIFIDGDPRVDLDGFLDRAIATFRDHYEPDDRRRALTDIFTDPAIDFIIDVDDLDAAMDAAVEAACARIREELREGLMRSMGMSTG